MVIIGLFWLVMTVFRKGQCDFPAYSQLKTMGNTRTRVNTESHILPTFESESSSSDTSDTEHSDDEKLAFIGHVMSKPCDMRQMFLNVSKPIAPRYAFKESNHSNDECQIRKLWIYSNVSHLWVCHPLIDHCTHLYIVTKNK